MKYLVTGGSGLLGGAIVKLLQAEGHQVRVLDLHPCPHDNIEMLRGSITDGTLVSQACQGVDVVIHTASLVSQKLGQPQELYDINVLGTQTIIEACQHHKVAKLIYTSSIDVVFDGTPICNGDETLPYPQKHLDYYGTTKTLAEQAVLNANGQKNVTTAVIRAAGIYGPRDKHRFPAIFKQVLMTGRFSRIGKGDAQFTHVFVDNIAYAHVLLGEELNAESICAGQVYFITDHAPSNFFDFFIPYFEALDIPYKEQVIPKSLAYSIANLLEWRYKQFGIERFQHVLLSRYTVAAIAEDFWFNHNKATHDFGYHPIVSAEQAFQQNLQWLKDEWLANQREL